MARALMASPANSPGIRSASVQYVYETARSRNYLMRYGEALISIPGDVDIERLMEICGKRFAREKD